MKSIELLSYCLHMLPKTHARGGKDQVEKTVDKKLSEVTIVSSTKTYLADQIALTCVDDSTSRLCRSKIIPFTINC